MELDVEPRFGSTAKLELDARDCDELAEVDPRTGPLVDCGAVLVVEPPTGPMAEDNGAVELVPLEDKDGEDAEIVMNELLVVG